LVNVTPETLVSVVLPTHDRPAWLAVALDSAVALKWPALEILVCDDGGLDETEQVVARHAGDRRVRLVRSDAKGVAANHRQALHAAAGEYITFLADDDRIAPEFIARRMARLEADPAAVVAFSGYRICDAALVPMRDFDPALPDDGPLDGEALVGAALARAWSINGSLYKRAAVIAAWPDEEAVGAAFDMALHLRLALTPGARGWYGHWTDIDYRLHEGQTSRGDAVMRHFDAGTRMYEYVLRQEIPARLRARIARDCAGWLVQWGRMLAQRGDLAGARGRMRHAVRTSPRTLVAWSQLATAYIAPWRLSPPG
jgi:glycosyltransferase involved in cell wall biosynthesis